MRMTLKALGLATLVALLGLVSYAVAGDGGSKGFSATPMIGYEENPDVSTIASGSFHGQLSKDGTTLSYQLGYTDLEGTVQQAHIHFGKPAVNGGISIFLCSNLGNGPAGTPACPQSGTVQGEVDSSDVVGPAAQGIEPGAFGEILAAMRAGHAYANVHSTKWPGGEIRAQIDDRGHDAKDDHAGKHG